MQIKDWSTDGRGHVRASDIIDWKAQAATDGSGDVLLRVEFSVDPHRTDVSSLQFRLNEQQARHIGATLNLISTPPVQESDSFFRTA